MLQFILAYGARSLWLAAWILLLLGGGCNRQTAVTVSGTVQKNGQPLPVSGTGVLQITLIPDNSPDGNYTPKIAECDRATGRFEIREVQPGKYKVGVEQFDPTPQSEKLNGAFRADNGKFVRDIDGKMPLTIDLAKTDS